MSKEDGEAGGSSAQPVPQMYRENTHIRVNSPENDLKTGRRDSPQLSVEKKPHRRGWEGGDVVWSQADLQDSP